MVFQEILSRLRTLARRHAPLLVSVEGRPGLPPLDFVLEATHGARRLVFEPPGLNDEGNRLALAERLQPFVDVRARGRPSARRHRWSAHGATPFPPARQERIPSLSDDWPSLFAALPAAAPLTLIVNEPQRLVEANRRFWKILGPAWLAACQRGQRVHLVLASSERGLGKQLNAADSPFRDEGRRLAGRPGPDPAEVVRIDPGSHYDLGKAAPHWRGHDLLLAWAVFGGLPSAWAAAIDAPGEATATAPKGLQTRAAVPTPSDVRATLPSPAETLRACLIPGRPPTATGPRDELERRTRKTRRYASLLGAIARGAASWRAVTDALGDDGGPGGAGPYLQHLRRLGLVVADRPLDAPSTGRRTRYRLGDPFEAFWWSEVHPARSELLSPDRAERAWTNRIEPGLPRVLASALPQICCNYLRFGAAPLLGAVARRAGPLWGRGFDFPAAAALANGGVCYAHVHPGPGPADLPALAALEAQVRKVRYGRDRQTRLRLLVSLTGFTEPLRREAAKLPLVRLAGAQTLAAPPEQSAPTERPPL